MVLQGAAPFFHLHQNMIKTVSSTTVPSCRCWRNTLDPGTPPRADSKIIYERKNNQQVVYVVSLISILSWTRAQFHSACVLRLRNLLGPCATQGQIQVMVVDSGTSTHGRWCGLLNCRLGGCSRPGHATSSDRYENFLTPPPHIISYCFIHA